jgi:hypothetical protein
MKSRGGLKTDQFVFFWRWQRRRCYLCAGRMQHPSFDDGRRKCIATSDHANPHSRRGGRRHNLVLAHRGCNQRKGDRPATACERWFAAEVWGAYESGGDPRRLPARSWKESGDAELTTLGMAFARAEELRQKGRTT